MRQPALFLCKSFELRKLLVFCTLFAGAAVHAQTLGGNAAYPFLRLPASAVVTGAGGVNVSLPSDEVGLALQNPSVLRSSMHAQFYLSFVSLPGSIQSYVAGGAYHHQKLQATFGAQLHFVNYGSVAQTDAAGNVSGSFRPVDFAMQFSAAKRYLDKWSVGASLKFIHSGFQQFSSQALAADVAVHFFDSSRQLSASVLAKNMGVALKSYAGQREELPFDLQVGVTKRLAKSPFGFSVTAQSLHRFNTLYNDTSFNRQNDVNVSGSFFNKLFGHFVFATHIYLGSHLEASVGYNVLQRRELAAPQGGNGLTGFSTGVRVKFQKLEVQYARTNYQRSISLNQLGLILKMNQLLGGL